LSLREAGTAEHQLSTTTTQQLLQQHRQFLASQQQQQQQQPLQQLTNIQVLFPSLFGVGGRACR
jgi:hypothetical protein